MIYQKQVDSKERPPIETSDLRASEQLTSRGKLPTVRLHGIALHSITEQQCVRYVMSELEAARGGWLVTHNLDHLRRLLRDRSFAALCETASVRVADGMPLVWACSLQGTPLPQRVTGSNLVSSLSAAAADYEHSIFLLGGNPGAADGAAAALCAQHPDLRIAGTSCPPPGFDQTDETVQTVISDLRRADPDIVYVALGSPKQERFISRLTDSFPRTWWIGVGISFSFLSGEVKRAPVWMQETGMEWAHRLIQEPRRLARRYLVDGLPFALRLLAHSAGARHQHTH